MNSIEIKGSRSEVKVRPASFNIQERASLTMNHMLENSDPKFNYVPWVGVTLGEDPPHFVHHRLDWSEVLPYDIYGWVMARDLTGRTDAAEREVAQRALYLSLFSERDGFIHSPKSPWNERYPMCLWEQTRALYALVYWYLDDHDERLMKYIEGIVDGVFSLSSQEGKQRVFPNEVIRHIGQGYYSVAAMVDPLVKVYEITGASKALIMAEGLTYFILNRKNGFFDEEGGFSTFYRTVVSSINGIARFAALVDDPRITERVKRIHDHARSLSTAYGSTPCTEPACSNMELTQSALSLIKLGYDEYWDEIDRVSRNQVAEAQFLDPSEWVKSKAKKGRILDKETWAYEGYKPNLAILPYDDYTDVVKRSVGGFMWTSADEHLFVPASLMLCCSAHALRTFHLLWQNALAEDWNGVTVNLHYSVENSLGEVISYEPYAGKTTVVLKKNAPLKVRIPEHAVKSKVEAKRGGKPVLISVKGRYASFGQVNAGEECSIEFDLHPRTTEEKQHVFQNKDASKLAELKRYQARWRGNTVIEITPESKEEKRIYKRKHLDTDAVKLENISHFISAKEIRW
jgi:hypothetical protein